ncbi:hypothetical protein [uncultured Treponema sp.]|uniref:hypothetical protein n=1 Tax=uncultured Treponema sp. TaxID=162155 RepID=UPI0025D67D94|nr:hypothetical protein [uncultured Treponema sp.]
MFKDCTSLAYIKCLATDISASACTNEWVVGVAASGTFVKAASMSDWQTESINGIPSGWTTEDATGAVGGRELRTIRHCKTATSSGWATPSYPQAHLEDSGL